MVDKKQIPTLSTNLFVNDPLLKLNRLYTYFLASEFNQTVTYLGHISSLKYLIYEYNHQPKVFVEKTKLTLETYLKRYYDIVEVIIDLDESNISFSLDIMCINSLGKKAVLSDTLKIDENKYSIYSKLLNYLYIF